MLHRSFIVNLILAASPLAASPLSVQAAVLITPQEARLAPDQGGAAAGGGDAFNSDRGGPTRGPDVIVQSPKGGVTSPFPLRVTFTPHSGEKIDPASVTVTLLSKPRVDLTSRVQPYISARGVDFPQAEAPPGRFRIRIDLTDSAGHIGTTTVDLHVQGGP
jgi:hypothetical protein